MDKLKNFLESVPNAKILDVGTGRGNFISIIDNLYEGYEKLIGIDIIEPAVKMAAKYFESNPKIEIIQQDINNCDFPAEYFDIVCLSNSLHHLEDKTKAFESMERLVKPGGYLLFNEMMKDNLNELQISHLLLHHFAARVDREKGRVHNDTYDRLEIVDVIKEYTKLKVTDFWDMIVPKQDINQAQIKSFAQTVDKVLSQLPEEKRSKSILEDSEAIKEYILKHGFQGCTQLVVIAKRS